MKNFFHIFYKDRGVVVVCVLFYKDVKAKIFALASN
jgi:hypothetical protein